MVIIRGLVHSALLLVLGGLGELGAQVASPSLPFGVGEELVYQVRSARFGKIGNGTMRIEGPEVVRDLETYLLHFDLEGRVGPFKIADETRSWLDPESFRSLRYIKRERHPLATRSEEVDLYPGELRWAASDGSEGELVTGIPLDELSFIYLLRTLAFEEGDELSLERHYQVERNPVVVRLVRRERVALPTGVMPTLLVEMQVRDGRRFNGSGVIRLNLTDDEHRYPVRIETTMPVVGTMTLDLISLTPAP